jgi:hypothetical protein
VQLWLDVDPSRVIARAWTVHCLVIGVLAVTCIAVCLAQWPVDGAPGLRASSLMLATSSGLVIYALVTSLVLQLSRTRCGAVYAIHATGIVTLGALVAY